MPNYVFCQGKVYIFEIDPITKLPTGYGRWLGNIGTDGLSINIETENFEHQESSTGDRLTDLYIETTKSVSGNIIFEEWSVDNLKLILYGLGGTVSSSSVTEEEHTAQLGKAFLLNNIDITTFTSLTDDGAVTTYVEGTDYTIDLQSGTVTVLAGGSIPDNSVVEANYTFAEHTNVTTFSSTNKDYWLRFNGLNTAQDQKPVIVDLCRFRVMPPQSIDLITDEMAQLECDFAGLYERHLDVPGGAYEGGFMRIRQSALAA